MTTPTSATSARNLFTESKARLSDRIQVNVNSTGSLAKQIVRGSKTNETLMHTARNFALQEYAVENSETNLKRMQLLTNHLNLQLDSIQKSFSKEFVETGGHKTVKLDCPTKFRMASHLN